MLLEEKKDCRLVSCSIFIFTTALCLWGWKQDGISLKYAICQERPLPGALVPVPASVSIENTSSEEPLDGGGDQASGCEQKGPQEAPVRGDDLGVVEWAPQPDRFLVALCSNNKISNQNQCFKEYLRAAARLHRTLIFPSYDSEFHYNYSVILDTPSLRECYGPKMVLSVSEFVANFSGGAASVAVDELLCVKESCAWDPNCPGPLDNIALPPRDSWLRPPEGVWHGNGRLGDEALALVAKSDARVVSLGDIFYYHFAFPFPVSTCKLWFQPHPAVRQTANGIVQALLGGSYMAVHLRRAEQVSAFFHCQQWQWCHFPIAQIVRFVAKKARASGVQQVFLLTNGASSEVELFERGLAAVSGGTLTISRLPKLTPDTDVAISNRIVRTEGMLDWAGHWNELDLSNNELAVLTLEKLVASMAKVFLGSIHSSFTEEIMDMRQELGTTSCHDSILCQGEEREPLPQLV